MTATYNNAFSDEINNIAVDTQKYAKWKNDGLQKMKQKATENVKRRTDAVQSIVTEIAHNWNKNVSSFIIPDEFRDTALNKLFIKFQTWSGVDIKACKNTIENWGMYWDRADNWFNRNKGEWFGDYYFTPIFQNHLKQYCRSVATSMYPFDIEKKECFHLLLYVQILKQISYENIRFKQTRPQSLLIDQSLVQSKKLQNFLLTLSKSHDIIWVLPTSKSAKLFRDSWRECIDKIFEQIQSIYYVIFNINNNNNNNNAINQQSVIPQQQQQQQIHPLYTTTTATATATGMDRTHETIKIDPYLSQTLPIPHINHLHGNNEYIAHHPSIIINDLPSINNNNNYNTLSIPVTMPSLPSQPINCCIVPITKTSQNLIIEPKWNVNTVHYGATHNSSQYVANHRYHPFSATNIQTPINNECNLLILTTGNSTNNNNNNNNNYNNTNNNNYNNNILALSTSLGLVNPNQSNEVSSTSSYSM